MSDNEPLTDENIVEACNKATTVSRFMEIARAAEKESPVHQMALRRAREYAGNAEEWTLIRDYFNEGSDEWEDANRVVKSY